MGGGPTAYSLENIKLQLTHIGVPRNSFNDMNYCARLIKQFWTIIECNLYSCMFNFIMCANEHIFSVLMVKITDCAQTSCSNKLSILK